MRTQIKILCPGRKCGKCRRMIQRIEEALHHTNVEADIIILDHIDDMLNYRTWILPTLIINEKVVARGYVPSLEKMQELMMVLDQ